MKPQLDDPTEGIWMRDNAHYPTPVTAFGSSMYVPPLSRAMETAFAEAGTVIGKFVTYWRSGEMYGRALPVGGKDGPAPPWWVLALVCRIHPEMRRRMKRADAFVAGLDAAAIAKEWNERTRPRFISRIDTLAAVALDALDDAELERHLDRVKALMADGQLEHFRLFMPYLIFTHRFHKTAKELLGWSDERIMSALAGHSEASAAPGRELEAMAKIIRARDDHDEIATASDPLTLLMERDAQLGASLREWVERWGLRASVYDPGAPTLAEQPELLAGVIRDAMNGEPTESAPPSELLAEARSQLAGDDRQRFDADFADACLVFPLREDNVIYTDNLLCGLARRAAMAIGRRLADRGQLERAERAVELFEDELRDALRTGDDASELAERRHAERMWVGQNPGPNYLNGAPTPMPDMRGLQRAGRIVNEALVWAMSLEYPIEEEREPNGKALHGIGAWPGTYTGEVRIVRSEDDLASVRPGDVLVASITVPAWSVVFPRIGALVTDRGGVLSHAAIVAREHGIPTVLATKVATRQLQCGQRVTVDGDNGLVTPC